MKEKVKGDRHRDRASKSKNAFREENDEQPRGSRMQSKDGNRMRTDEKKNLKDESEIEKPRKSSKNHTKQEMYEESDEDEESF